MDETKEKGPGTKEAPEKSFQVTAPSISLPKGGGAIRGMGEKFAANPVTGTGSMSVPIATSPGRSGFGPQLALSYDSGAGNGPFGFGWSLSLPQITRKTEKGLPRYLDGHGQATDSDIFILSGAEDLVPEFEEVANDACITRDGPYQIHEKSRIVNHQTYRIRRYRPRIEGLFARIERWTNQTDSADVFWRSISKDNITTWYGKTSESRICDPADPSRIFSWLICQSYDDKGNVIVYRYKEEDSGSLDLTQANERNRTAETRKSNRYVKRIFYGNRVPYLPVLSETGWSQPPDLNPTDTLPDYHFEVVFDYEDGHYTEAAPDAEGRVVAQSLYSPPASAKWSRRVDPFSTYRAGFEVRTYRLCQRVLMFHHFPDELDMPDCLVRSTDFTYSYENDPHNARNPIFSFLHSASQSGYIRQGTTYQKKSLPPVEFEYTRATVQDLIEEVDPESLENLPTGLDGTAYRWTDLHGEGIPGILTEQAGAWYYKRNSSPIPSKLPDGSEVIKAKLSALETVALRPNLGLSGGAEFMDLAGDGLPDLVVLGGSAPGLHEHDEAEGWQPFRPFTSPLNHDMRDPNLKFVDLDGDGRADVLITEDDVLVWHPSLAEEGFGPAQRVAQALDEEQGPRLILSDGTQSIYLADLNGDGLTDLVRIRNGEVCYWPNLGYGRFGAKVSMDNAPWFDNPDQFDHQRIRLADIDGSGTTDIIYLHRDGVRLYFNQSGNSWGNPQQMNVFPRVDEIVSIVLTDLLGNGTACLVWSSPLTGDAQRPMCYVNLMGKHKPHLLVKTINNLGAETCVDYAPSTKFYLLDKQAGKPWVSRLPFPVHVVERVTTYDHISRNRFVTRYTYHHGYFDGVEREFRGFGRVDKLDTEEFAALTQSGAFPTGENIDAASHVPPVLTKTWFHTGIYLRRDWVSNFFAGLLDHDDVGEYYREPGLTDAQARALLLPDTVLPPGLTQEEEREACRALKGAILRQELYALDGTEKAGHPYTVTEQNFTIRHLQPEAGNRYAVFFTHPCEALSYHFERNSKDPRVSHEMTLEVDAFGNVLKQATIGYGRRKQIRLVDDQGNVQQVLNPGLIGLDAIDQAKQTTPLLTYTENRVTNAIDRDDVHRSPLPCESVTYELTGYTRTGMAARYQASDFVEPDPALPARLRLKFTDEVTYEAPVTGHSCRRPIEWLRTLYRRDDLNGLLPLEQIQSLALPGESYKLAFTPGLLDQVFQRRRQGQADEPLLPDPAAVLGGTAGNQGGYVDLDGNASWWVPAGRSFFHPNDVAPHAELAEARTHFFLPRRYRDPFGHDVCVDFDANDLLMVETRDALRNRVTVNVHDYRVLEPRLVSDPNRNQTEVAFDALGMVVGTAVLGKPEEGLGDNLAGFLADLPQTMIEEFFSKPQEPDTDVPFKRSRATAIVHQLLGNASTCIVYDLDRFRRTQKDHSNEPDKWEPSFAATIVRETHVSDLRQGEKSKVQLSFSYSDGFGREIQKKIQAEPGPFDVIDPLSPIANPRWAGSGWTIFNNKGNPVRQYEPFFSTTHRFEFNALHGISSVLFYDPADRMIATLHPNHTYEKVVFNPWQQTTYDLNDTCAPRNQQTGDPRTDPDIQGYVAEYFKALPANPAQPWQTWHTQRIGGAMGLHERDAAQRAAAHADTPTTVHFDSIGRKFLSVARNRVVCVGHALDGTEESVATRVELDIEGNQHTVRDEHKLPVNHLPTGPIEQRIVMRYAYDMLGKRIHQLSMEAGARWMLYDVAGKPIRAWDSRGHNLTTAYDALRRPVGQTVHGTFSDPDPTRPNSDLRTLNRDILVDKIEYGEPPANASQAELDRALRLNMRTRIYRHFDSAGVATNARLDASGNPTEAYDFKGNLLRSTRRLAKRYKEIPDWAQELDSQLDDEFFESSTRYDAFNRPIQSVAPHSNLRRGKFNIIQPVFNEANLLERVDVWLERTAEPGALLVPAHEPASPVGVANIDYDAKGQRQRIDYNNNAGTFYSYDPLTFRLTQLLTKRKAADFPADDPQAVDPGWSGKQVQNLHYSYDPAGNITHIQDDAQQTIYFRNKRVEPSSDYIYDALYRLIQATGREHLGQGGAPTPQSYNDAGHGGIFSASPAGRFAPNEVVAMGTYIEGYVYDAVGNFLQMQHRGSDPAHAGWTRAYVYHESSLIEDGIREPLLKTSNRLTRTTVNPAGNTPQPETYQHDAHGNMLRMPHLAEMQWDYKDQLRLTRRQRVNDDDLDGNDYHGERTFYVYDAAGQRIRKVCEKAPGLTEERIYLRGFEIFRKHGGPIGANTETLERETLHIMDDKQCIALVETRTLDTAGDDQALRQMIRYQFGNHLGSASLELNEQAQIISYEEYFPYGSTSYQAVRSQTETAKRYRYTGKERDKESGLYYHGARYYAPWLGRWTAIDAGGLRDSPNLFVYVNCNPIIYTDPNGKAINLAAAGIGALLGGIGGAALGAWNAKPGERWAGAGKGAAIGAGAGALAGLTFGVSLAATGAVGIGGTAVATGGTTGSVLISGTLAGAVGGGTSAAANTLVAGGTGQEALEMASIGAFTGSVGGAVGGSTAVVTSNLARSAGASQLVSYSLGGATAGVTGDVATQAVSIAGGVQRDFSPAQLLVSTAGGGAGGALASRLAPQPQAPNSSGTQPTATNWRQHEANVTQALRSQNPGANVGSQVTIDVTGPGPTGPRTVTIRIDNTVPTQTGTTQLVDAKFSAVRNLADPNVNLQSTVTANQSEVYGWVSQGTPVTAVPRGPNAVAAGFTPGVPISLEPSVQMCVNNPTGGITTRNY